MATHPRLAHLEPSDVIALLDRAADMLFAAAGALIDKEMPKLGGSVGELAMEINERCQTQVSA